MVVLVFRIAFFCSIIILLSSCHFFILERKRGVTCDDLVNETPSNCIRGSYETCAYNFTKKRCEKAPTETYWPTETISAGDDSVCAVGSGKIHCFGGTIPVTISLSNGANYSSVVVHGATGSRSSLKMTDDGTVDILGFSDRIKAAFSTKNYGFFSLRFDHICALEKSDGTLICHEENNPPWYDFPSGIKARYLSTGTDTCAVLKDGSLRCFFSDNLRTKMEAEPRGVFEKVFVANDWEFFACATKLYDRKPICWSEKDKTDNPVVKNVPQNEAFRHIALSSLFAVGIKESDQKLEWWGNETNAVASKVRDDILAYGQDPMLMVTAAMDFACAVKIDHTVVCFGKEDIKTKATKNKIDMKDDLLIDIPHTR